MLPVQLGASKGTDMKLLDGTVHKLPADLKAALVANAAVQVAWQDITPLARNEFICWVEDAKKPETRTKRIAVAVDKLARGERRPCCWIGCTHRPDKPLSPSVAGILAKRMSSRSSQE
jgi:hypothetical protein